MASPLADAAEAHVESLSVARPQPQQQQATSRAETSSQEGKEEGGGYQSRVGILSSSIPFYHNQFMEARKKAKRMASQGESLDPAEAAHFSRLSADTDLKELSADEQAANVRRLKPHSRSTIQLQNITSQAPGPDVHSQAANKKKNASRWQFGIRSRNQPLDAVHCIYKALKKQGAEWHVAPPKEVQHDSGPYPVNVAGATHLSTVEARLSESPEKDRHRSADQGQDPPYVSQEQESDSTSTSTAADLRHEDESYDSDDIDPDHLPPGYIPKDPWVIHVRWRKDGMNPRNTTQPNSARSSHVDLHADDLAAYRRSSVLGSISSSATGSATSVHTGGLQASTVSTTIPQPDTSCYVYMDVQLYTMEQDTYLVDFKCAGYESVVEQVMSDSEREFVGSGYRVADKDVTSPQPFLDLTNKLVIHLARG
ncbi:MAG: hypothetical protein Q9190_001277 [Brigantiaea leucoxantha]